MKTQHTFQLWSLLLTIQQAQAWTYSTTNIEVSSPPPLHKIQFVSGALVNESSEQFFPCNELPFSDDIERTPFPISDGRLSYSLSNTSTGSLSSFVYQINPFIGQISLPNGSYSIPSRLDDGRNHGYTGAGVEVWKDFSSGTECSRISFDIIKLIGNALDRDDMTIDDVRGMNATFGILSTLFGLLMTPSTQ
jgi:hypothetical protein